MKEFRKIGLASAESQPVQQRFFFAEGNINGGTAGHHKVTAFALMYINFVQLEKVGIVRGDKNIFSVTLVMFCGSGFHYLQ